MRYYVLLLLFLGACLLTACGSDAGRTVEHPMMFTKTEITPLTQDKGQRAPKIVLSTPAETQQLYRSILALPHLPEHPICEHKKGRRYQVAFIAVNQTFYATIDKNNCGTIAFEQGDTKIRQGTTLFWVYLTNLTLGKIP
ncbi:hypothetical protein [Ktedonospora formicarum]|uniref:Lipoprotein n=1 Tax=Ktedonospora formicarum TaxID=2778364 RepID=A0A8J3HYA0_9CHLR|nr:hypothetical protein [Ktedonospora formicarum]GHO46427.1 hypothetical protein KSX_45900 [Ktedonospora formicarum]